MIVLLKYLFCYFCSISEMVTDADLKFLIENLEEKTRENEKWDNVIEKRNDLLSYYAKCCKPKVVHTGVVFLTS